MRVPVLPPMLKPAGWLIAGLLAVAALLLLVQGVGFRWDPFDRTRRRLEAAEVHAGTAEAFPNPPPRDQFGLPMAIWA